MHYVYIVRRGPNEELRYSLRSLVNAPDVEQVWIVGDKPSWVTGVEFLRGNRQTRAQMNVIDNLAIACQHPDMPDRFVVMNDDFFIMRKMRTIPTWYRGPLAEHIAPLAPSWWRSSLVLTRQRLLTEGHKDPLSYELHVPFTVDRDRLLDAVEWCRRANPIAPAQWRTAYGVRNRIGGRPHRDGKVTLQKGKPEGHTVLSTDDRGFTKHLAFIHDAFPEPSRWEAGRR